MVEVVTLETIGNVADGVEVQAVVPQSSRQGLLEGASRLLATCPWVEPSKANAHACRRLEGVFAQDPGTGRLGSFENFTKAEHEAGIPKPSVPWRCSRKELQEPSGNDFFICLDRNQHPVVLSH